MRARRVGGEGRKGDIPGQIYHRIEWQEVVGWEEQRSATRY